MPRKFLRKYLPDHERVRSHRHLRWLRPLMQHPNLWHLNRLSVSGGVALGLFAGMIPGPVQMLSAALLAVLFRVNLPVAVVCTLYTNPFTAAPAVVFAYSVGRWVMGQPVEAVTPPPFAWEGGQWADYLPALWQWLGGLGEPFLLGSLVIAVVLALLGFCTVRLGWRLYLLAYLRQRRLRVPDPGSLRKS